MTDDDDLGPAYSLPPDDAHPGDIAERVMLMPEHRHLTENEISFGWLMRNEPKVKGNRVELGSVHETQHMGQGAFKDLFEHQFRGTMTIGGQSYTATMQLQRAEPEQPSGIGDIHCTIPLGEPLAKVLPAGGPLVTTWWTCTACGHSQRGGPPATCQAKGPYHRCPLEADPL